MEHTDSIDSCLTIESLERWLDSQNETRVCGTDAICPMEVYFSDCGFRTFVTRFGVTYIGEKFPQGGHTNLPPKIVEFVRAIDLTLRVKTLGWSLITIKDLRELWNKTK